MVETVGDMAPLNAQPELIKKAVEYCSHQSNKGIDSLVALMKRTGEDWKRCLDGVSETQADFSPAKGEWTTSEVVTHFLQATDGVNSQIRKITMGEDVGQLAAAGPDVKPTTTPSLRELSAKTVAIFDDIADLTQALEGNSNLHKQFPHPAFGELDVLQWIAFQRLHGMDHMQQIEKNKADAAYPKE